MQKTDQTGPTVQGHTAIRALYRNAALLPSFLRNLTMQIILDCRLGNMHFIKTYPRFLRNKDSTREEYEGKFSRMGDWFTLTPIEFANQLFSTNPAISDLQLNLKIFAQCQQGDWLGSTASQYISALKHFGTIYGSLRFHTDEWKNRQSDLRKTFGTRRSDQRMKKAISRKAFKKVYTMLRAKGSIREAEILRFMTLVGQRNVDYHKLIPTDIFIDVDKKIIKITWRFSKTRSAHLPYQLTLHPFGIVNTFFDLHTCVQTLLHLKPKRAIYLLRLKHAHSTFLRKSFGALPECEQPECLAKITPYYFKNVVAQCCLETKVAAEVASHYLKHTLSDQEWKLYCENSHINLSKVSANYAIAENLVPHIQERFAPWYNAD